MYAVCPPWRAAGGERFSSHSFTLRRAEGPFAAPFLIATRMHNEFFLTLIFPAISIFLTARIRPLFPLDLRAARRHWKCWRRKPRFG